LAQLRQATSTLTLERLPNRLQTLLAPTVLLQLPRQLEVTTLVLANQEHPLTEVALRAVLPSHYLPALPPVCHPVRALASLVTWPRTMVLEVCRLLTAHWVTRLGILPTYPALLREVVSQAAAQPRRLSHNATATIAL